MRITILALALLLGGCSELITTPAIDINKNIDGVVSHQADSTNKIPIAKMSADGEETSFMPVVTLPTKPENLSIDKLKSLRPRLPGSNIDVLPKNSTAYWLQQAQYAYQQDNLTTPFGGSAFDYFNKVLLIDPQNSEAMVGMESIVQRYLKFAQISYTRGELAQAKRYLQRAEKVNPNQNQVWQALKTVQEKQQELAAQAVLGKSGPNLPLEYKAGTDVRVTKGEPQKKAALDKTKKAVGENIEPSAPKLVVYLPIQTRIESVMKAPKGTQRQNILLPAKVVKNKAAGLIAYLDKLAKQVEKVDGRLLIMAPKDSQVRWLYTQLNRTNPDYRIRANIKHTSPVAIQVTYLGSSPVLDVFQ